MLPRAHLIPFLITVYVLIVIPGPSVVFTVSRGVALGRRAALATVLGNTSGLMLRRNESQGADHFHRRAADVR